MVDFRRRVPQYRCSFCGKSQEDVRRLIAGPAGYICDECVESRRETSTNEGDLCSFCGKSQSDVESLFIGLNGVRICNECIELCREIIDEEDVIVGKPDSN